MPARETSRLKRTNQVEVKRQINQYFFGGGYQQSMGMQSKFHDEFSQCVMDTEGEKQTELLYTRASVPFECQAQVAVAGKHTIRIIA